MGGGKWDHQAVTFLYRAVGPNANNTPSTTTNPQPSSGSFDIVSFYTTLAGGYVVEIRMNEACSYLYAEAHFLLDGRRTGDWTNKLLSGGVNKGDTVVLEERFPEWDADQVQVDVKCD
ncbi:MAG: hypothetical protein OXJ55_15945 [Caldilineaceae bacterium]|nr:hypothetical protein [Caldilineaceae bacterium]